MINKTKGSYPSNEIGKTAKDQRIIRPVDLNKVIDNINDEFIATTTGNVIFTVVDVDGTPDAIVLDADGDTTISAPTDDQIDFEISGVDDFRMTANTFTALSGSSIATNTITETTSASGVTIDGVLVKDGGVTLADGAILEVDTINEAELDAGITIEGVSVKDSSINAINITLNDGSVGNLALKLGADTNNGIYGVSDTQLGVAVEGTLVGGFNTTGLFTDVISEQVTNAGVTVDSVLLKDGTVTDSNGLIKPYKSYVSTISQSGTSDPVATVLENNLSGVITWARTGVGTYTGTLASAFTVNKTWTSINLALVLNGSESLIDLVRQDANVVLISVLDTNFTPTDNFNGNLEIRVYP